MAFNPTLPAAQWGSAAVIPAADVEGQPGKLVRLINLHGDVQKAQSASIGVYAQGYDGILGASRVTIPGGPLVAVANFSGEGGGGQIEFDVPTNLQVPANNYDVINGGGGMVCFPCANVDLSVRNDGNYIPSPGIAGGIPIGFIAGEPQRNNRPRAQAVTGIGSKTGRLTRTVWLLNTAGTAAPFTLSTPVPPFARTFRVFRNQSVAADVLSIEVAAGSLQPMDTFNLPGTILCPDLVCGNAALIRVSAGAPFAGNLLSCCLVFTLQMGGE